MLGIRLRVSHNSLVVVALRCCRHGGERGGAAGEAASDDALAAVRAM
jgi:hypothetical protein